MAEPTNGEPTSLAGGLRWLRAQAVWFRDRDDVLGRVYSVVEVARGFCGVHAVLVNFFLVLPRSTNEVGVVCATLALIFWHVWISHRMRRPSRRTAHAHLADLGVTLLIALTTVWVVPPGAAPLTLAGYWLGGAAIYAAILRGTAWGVTFAMLSSASLIVVPSHFTMERIGLAFIIILLTSCAGVLISQFRATIVAQERERIHAAALAERERLSRIVHDGVLQVLALVEREAPSLGSRGLRLAALARESEAQLRTLLQDREVLHMERTKHIDLAAALDKYQSARVTVSTMASPVMVPRLLADDVQETLVEVLHNVEEHAGPDAQAWILLDQEADDEMIVWIRDNGVGMDAEAVARAADNGRMGIRDSIIGRMAAIGGQAILKSSPGAGTEWELRFPINVEEMEGEG